MSMAQSMQMSEIADMIGEHDTRVWRVVKYYVEDARSREDLSDVSIIGIDETSSAKGHNYVTLAIVSCITPKRLEKAAIVRFC